jgi:NitT/TauT family transport system substrate-binding protein
MRFQHTGGALEAVNLLLAGRADHALLSEPVASMAVLRSSAMVKSENKASDTIPLLEKGVDMRGAWQEAFPGHRLAGSSIAFFGERADDTPLMQAFAEAYAKACQWVRDNPAEAGRLAHRQFPALAAQMEQGAMDRTEIHVLNGKQARDDALFFLARIHAINPDAVGGTLPDRDFFGAVQ